MKKKKGLHDEIARVAYESYETRDRADGHNLDDWRAGVLNGCVGDVDRHDPAVTQGLNMVREKTVNIQFLGAAGCVNGSKYLLPTAGSIRLAKETRVN